MKSRANLRIASPSRRAPPQRNPAPVAMSVAPLQLSPIPWGTPDLPLARSLCQNILDTTPPTVIPFDPRTHNRMRRDLRSHGIHH